MARVKAQAAKREITKLLTSLSNTRPIWEVWQDFIIISACALSIGSDPSPMRYQERANLMNSKIQKYSPSERKVIVSLVEELGKSLEENPEQDFLGSVYMELELGNHWIGQFFTPYCLCECMASMTLDKSVNQIEEQGFITLNDCACGAGATLIAGIHAVRKQLLSSGSPLNWQNHVLVTAQDLDYVTGLMCYIQLSLQGAAGYVKIGNTFSDPMTSGDRKDNYWYTPYYFSPVWTGRRMCRKLDEIFADWRGK